MTASSTPDHSEGSDNDGGAAPSTSSLPRRVRGGERKYQSEMMFIGQRCHWHECHREDFLPFTCADCNQTFCSQHFRTSQHACPTATPTFVVPLCPLCHEPPKNWKRDEDPNVAMNAHLTPNAKSGLVECEAIDANGAIQSKGIERRTKRENECQERRCKKLMVVPIKCPACAMCFCPSHRAPNQHQCQSTIRPTTTSAPQRKTQNWTTASVEDTRGSQQDRPHNKIVDKLNIPKAVSAANNSRKVDKWVPKPIFQVVR